MHLVRLVSPRPSSLTGVEGIQQLAHADIICAAGVAAPLQSAPLQI
jgi:hypothetical protein